MQFNKLFVSCEIIELKSQKNPRELPNKFQFSYIKRYLFYFVTYNKH